MKMVWNLKSDQEMGKVRERSQEQFALVCDSDYSFLWKVFEAERD